ncbi:MAG TPA: peptide ABC transporter substrate-binding protein [Candidatus Acidoferrum sp.]|nr:peptide ABC transporter substrate-binding protein [Candidatus Acidoferrum sp.]
MSAFANALFHVKRAFHFFAIGLAVLLVGCKAREQRADLVLINGVEPETIDPHVLTGQADGRVAGALFDGLMQFDPKTGDAVPGIAERFEISPDGLTYTFHLRTNAAWSTGDRITAEDCVLSWRRAVTPETVADYAGQLFYIRNAEAYFLGRTNASTGKRYTAEDIAMQALDDHTMRVDLVAPTAFFPELCACWVMKIVPAKAIEKYGDRWMRRTGVPFSGAFTLESWTVNDRIRMRKNPHYWNAAQVQFEVVDWLPLHDPNLALNTFLRGDADLIFDKRRVPAELIDVLRQQPYTHAFDVFSTFFYRYNVTRKPFDDPRVRKALAMAVDKRRIVDRIIRGGELIATHFTPPGIRGYEPPQGIGYDPEGARELLAEAGYPNGTNFPLFRFLVQSTTQPIQTAVELQEMWKRELNIRMELQPIEWKVFLRQQSQTNFDLSYSSWIGDYKDPNTFLDMFMEKNGNNRTGWRSARYDALMHEANSQADKMKRFALLREAEAILVRAEAPIVPLYFEKGLMFYDPNKVEGVYSNLVDEHPVWAMRRKAGRPSTLD